MQREKYEAPEVVEFGTVSGLTLGSGGSCHDGANGWNKKLPGNGVCDQGNDDNETPPK